MAVLVRSFLLLLLLAAHTAHAAELPRYRFKVGQELRFTTDALSGEGDERVSSHGELTAWIVGKDVSGWKIVFAGQRTYEKGPEKKAMTYAELAVFHLAEDGTVTELPKSTLIPDSEVLRVFPSLPDDKAAALAGWTAKGPKATTSLKYLPLSEKALDREPFEFDAVERWKALRLRHREMRYHFRFDRPRGLVERVESGIFQSHRRETSANVRFVESKSRDAAALVKLEREVEILDTANSRYWEVLMPGLQGLRMGKGDTAKARSALGQARKVMADAQARISEPLLQAWLKDRARLSEIYERMIKDSAERLGKILNHAAPAWDALDLKGVRHSSRDTLGKVVFLDFWFAGCGPCIGSMPKVKELAKIFHGKDVLVLSMNPVDSREVAANAAADLALNFPVLLAKGIETKFMVDGYPSTIVIDRKGVVRHFGNHFAVDEMKKLIEKLLAE